MSVLPILLSIIPPAILPARVLAIGAMPIRAVPIRPVLLPLDGGGFSALGSDFNI
jgi:hypothetical protein